MLHHKENLKKLKQEIRNCQRCAIGQMGRQVSPEGPVDAKVIVVCPRPVSGDPIDIITAQLLEFSGVELGDTYRTALFMCDTEPVNPFIASCKVWKDVELSLFYPKLVIMVGQEVLHYFFPGTDLNELDASLQKSSRFEGAAFLPIKDLKDEDKETVSNKFGLYSTVIKAILRKPA
jgi:uracil-DNA glycosylase